MAVTYQDQLEKMYEKIKRMKEEAVEDVKIRKDDLFHSHNVDLSIKWINKKMDWLRVVKIYDTDKKAKYRSLYEYYRTDFDIKLSTAAEYSMFIDSDTNMVMLSTLHLTAKEAVAYIDSVIDTIKQRQWEIKSFIQWELFKNGQ
jgi:arginine repressor